MPWRLILLDLFNCIQAPDLLFVSVAIYLFLRLLLLVN